MKKAVDWFLKQVDFEDEGSFFLIQAYRSVLFKKFGGEGVDYLDKQIGEIVKGGKGSWGGKNDMPQE